LSRLAKKKSFVIVLEKKMSLRVGSSRATAVAQRRRRKASGRETTTTFVGESIGRSNATKRPAKRARVASSVQNGVKRACAERGWRCNAGAGRGEHFLIILLNKYRFSCSFWIELPAFCCLSSPMTPLCPRKSFVSAEAKL
jgi:hypothetical protein